MDRVLRFVIPRFDGEEVEGTCGRIDAALAEVGAERIRVHKGFGVTTFSLPNGPGILTEEKRHFALLQRLHSIHPNCVAWTYSKLDRLSCDRRKTW